MKTIATPPVQRIALLQLSILLPVSLVLGIIDVWTGCSALLGGLVQVGPQAWFNRHAFRYSGARQAWCATRAFFYGETGKFLLTAILFAVIFVYFRQMQPLVMFSVYALMTVVNWIGAARALKRLENRSMSAGGLRKTRCNNKEY